MPLIPTLALIVALAGLFAVHRSQNAADDAAAQAEQVKAQAQNALTLALDAETGVRGYAATGDPSFLEPYDRAVTDLPGAVGTLRTMVARDRVQSSRADRMRRLSGVELTTLALLRQAVAAGAGRDNAELGGVAASGKKTVDGIRAEVAAIEARADRDREARESRDHRLGALALAITLATGLIGVLGGLMAAWVVSNSEEARRRAERDAAAQALKASEQERRHNALVLASATEGITTIGPDGQCTSVNPRGAAMLGYEPRELIGADLHALVHHHRADGSEYPASQCRIRLASQAKQSCRVDDEVFWRKDGTRLPVEYAAAPLLADGEFEGAVVTFVDISARRAIDLEAEEQAAELRAAIGRGELVLHYQPKIGMTDERVTGVEALVRWAHPQRGLVFPDEFIPLAERAAVTGDLTAWVLEAAVTQVAAWQADGLALPVAVNLSVDSLLDPGFPDSLDALCRRHGVSPSLIELEVTESGVMTEPARAVAVLEALVEKGFALALDDFGTGFSSLAYLRSLPASVVKIDKSFVMDLPRSRDDAHIVRGTIELAHGLGKRVVAEGVETADALEYLLRVGCDAGQGYYWSRPVPAAELEAWLDKRRARRAGVWSA